MPELASLLDMCDCGHLWMWHGVLSCGACGCDVRHPWTVWLGARGRQMTDITAKATAFWESLRLTETERNDQRLKAIIIEAFEQGYMAHDHRSP
jgi:hypothetical protein